MYRDEIAKHNSGFTYAPSFVEAFFAWRRANLGIEKLVKGGLEDPLTDEMTAKRAAAWTSFLSFARQPQDDEVYDPTDVLRAWWKDGMAPSSDVNHSAWYHSGHLEENVAEPIRLIGDLFREHSPTFESASAWSDRIGCRAFLLQLDNLDATDAEEIMAIEGGEGVADVAEVQLDRIKKSLRSYAVEMAQVMAEKWLPPFDEQLAGDEPGDPTHEETCIVRHIQTEVGFAATNELKRLRPSGVQPLS